jgi:hypothetical protein
MNKARAPAFDHTTFTNKGRYMRLDMNQISTIGQIVTSSLVSDYLEPPLETTDVCRIRFYYHFIDYSETFYLRLALRYMHFDIPKINC